MQKFFTHLLLLGIIGGCGQLSATAINVSTQPRPKKVLIEEFTGIHCGNCPDGHRAATRLMKAQPDNVYVVCVHAGYYATPGIGEPDFITEAGTTLNDYFEVTGYPSAIINRSPYSESTIIYRSNWGNAGREQASLTAPVNLWTKATYDEATKEITVNVEGYFTGSPGEAPMLNIALVQNYIQGPQSGGLVGSEYIHRHMLRDILTPMWGDALTDMAEGKSFEKTYTYTLPADYKEVATVATDMEIVAFVTQGIGGEVMNVTGSHLECPGMTAVYEPIVSEGLIPISKGYGFDFVELYVENRSTEAITEATFNIKFNGVTTTANWTGNVPPHSLTPIRVPIDWDTNANPDSDNSYAITLSTYNSTAATASKAISGKFIAATQTGASLKFNIRTDRYAADNRYRLLDSHGNLIKEFGPYANGEAADYEETHTFTTPGTYCLEVTDSWADGIYSPRGYVKVYTSAGSLVAQQNEINQFGCRIFLNVTSTSQLSDASTDNALSYEPLSMTLTASDNQPITVYSMSGQTAAHGLGNLDLSHIANGIYIATSPASSEPIKLIINH